MHILNEFDQRVPSSTGVEFNWCRVDQHSSTMSTILIKAPKVLHSYYDNNYIPLVTYKFITVINNSTQRIINSLYNGEFSQNLTLSNSLTYGMLDYSAPVKLGTSRTPVKLGTIKFGTYKIRHSYF